MNTVLCIGEALIDMICTDKDQTLAHGQHFVKKAGGAPANVAAAIAAMGGSAALVARVGADPFGQYLLDVLRSFNVSVNWVWQDERCFTTLAFVSLLSSGERDFYFNRGADGQLNSEDVGAIDLHDFSIVHFGSATAFLPGPLQSAYADLFKRAGDARIFTSFDPNYRHLLFGNDQRSFIEKSWQFIAHCNFFKVSDEEAILLTGCRDVNEAAKVFLESANAVFTITLGKEGTLLGLHGETEIVPSIPVKAVDTTGAGDAFTGAVLCQLSSKTHDDIIRLPRDEWRKIVFNANKAGAYTCEYYGAMEALKHLDKSVFDQ